MNSPENTAETLQSIPTVTEARKRLDVVEKELLRLRQERTAAIAALPEIDEAELEKYPFNSRLVARYRDPALQAERESTKS